MRIEVRVRTGNNLGRGNSLYIGLAAKMSTKCLRKCKKVGAAGRKPGAGETGRTKFYGISRACHGFSCLS